MNEEQLVKRMSILKLLYRNGIDQSYQSEMIAFFSILSFHDSIEMFLKLAAEHKGIKDCKHFMEYWDKIPALTLKESMRNLNTIRVNLKHKGLIPAKIEVETARVNTVTFLEENTPTIFNLQFNEISLFNLIKFEKTKKYLIAAQDDLDMQNIKSSVDQVTKSFYELLEEYKHSKRDWGNKTHLDLVERVTYVDKSRLFGGDVTVDPKLTKVVERIDRNFENVERAFEVMALGLDYRKYMKFRILTPVAHRYPDGGYSLEVLGEKSWTKKNCQFLIDFVLECAFRLQDFDFEYESLDSTKFSIGE